jgi:hypothetical protein
MTSFSEAQKFLEQNFIRKNIYSFSVNVGRTMTTHPFAYDHAWKVSENLHVYRRCQTNGLFKTVLFVKNVGVIQVYDLEEEGIVHYTKVSLLEDEVEDYMQELCYTHNYKGSGRGGLIFSLVYPRHMSRRRIDIIVTRRGGGDKDEISYEVNGERKRFIFQSSKGLPIILG